MFNRALFKENAKFCLKRYYWLGFLVTLVTYALPYAIISSVTNSVNLNFLANSNAMSPANMPNLNDGIEAAEAITSQFLSSGMLTPLIISFIVILAVSFFLKYPLTVGKALFFTKSREDRADFAYLFHPYKKNLGSSILTMFMVSLRLFLWYLLAYTPTLLGEVLNAVTKTYSFGYLSILSLPLYVLTFVKYYQYSMIPYLIAENPNMTTRRAFELSKKMTKGYKGELFVLFISFIGWYLLGWIACCIGVLFVWPYHQAAKAEAYTFLKAMAKANGFTDDAELPGFTPIAAVAPAAVAPAIEETAVAPAVEAPVAEEVPAIEEAPVAEDIPAIEEAPVIEEAPAIEEAPVIEEAPAVEDIPTIDDVPTVDDIPEIAEMPVIDDAPAADIPADGE